MSPIAYAILCVAAPLAWGVVVALVSNRIDARRAKKTGKPPADPPIEYTI